MSDIKALAKRSKEALDSIQTEVQAKRMSLDAALGHAFIAGTDHMAELRKIQDAEMQNPALMALQQLTDSELKWYTSKSFGPSEALKSLLGYEIDRRKAAK